MSVRQFINGEPNQRNMKFQTVGAGRGGGDELSPVVPRSILVTSLADTTAGLVF